MLKHRRIQQRARLENLEHLIAEAGSATRLAQLAGTSSSYLSQVRNRRQSAAGPNRSIGDDLASRLERAMSKPDGWIDEFHGNSGDHSLKPELGAQNLRPLISWVQAGAWTEVDGPFTAQDAEALLPCPVRCSNGTFVLRVRGESMEPRFHDGDLIFVDPAVSPDHGRFVVVCDAVSGMATFKQLIVEGERKYLKALNPDWPHRIIESHSNVAICGVVIFKGEVT